MLTIVGFFGNIFLVILLAVVGITLSLFLFFVTWIRLTFTYFKTNDWKPPLPHIGWILFSVIILIFALFIFILHTSVLHTLFPDFCASTNYNGDFTWCKNMEQGILSVPAGYILGWLAGVAFYFLIFPLLYLQRKYSSRSQSQSTLMETTVMQRAAIIPPQKNLLFRAIKIGLVVVAIYFVADMFLFTGFRDPFLRIQTVFSSDKIIQEFSCDIGYSWRIVEKDKVARGNMFELGRSSSLQKYRVLQLISRGSTIAEMGSNDVASADEFPTGESFTKAFVFGNDSIYTGREDRLALQWQLKIPSDKISESDFENVAHCLNDNINTLEKQLNYGHSYFYPIGWMIRVDNSVKKDAYSNAPAFECSDGQMAITWGYYLRFVSAENKNQSGLSSRPSDTIGVIGTDGKVYKGALRIDMTLPEVTIPAVQCVNSNGQFLQSFLASIPNRIVILNR